MQLGGIASQYSLLSVFSSLRAPDEEVTALKKPFGVSPVHCSNKQSILNHIDRFQFLDQSTNTPAALRYMRDVMFTAANGDRRDAPNVAIVITDGVPR